MKVVWARGNDKISFNRPNVFFITGIRGAGKSSLLEHIGEKYLEHEHAIFDLFGSKDGENLAWLRSPWAEEKRILLLKGSGVDVDCSWPVKHVDSVTLHDFETHDIIISSSPFYANLDQEYVYAAKLTDLLYKRLSWRRLIYCIVREAANLYYSRLKISDNQTQAKAEMVYLIRESRHMGLALGLDSLRWHAIDIDIRSLSDYIIFKNMGQMGLSKEMKFLYSFIEPHTFRYLKPNHFVITTKKGGIGFGVFPYHEWHKREGENILKALGIKVEYGEIPKQSIDKGTFKTVSDAEHAEIIRLYVEENLGFVKIAQRIGRSSRTVSLHVHGHNQAVERSGFCPACKRIGAPYFDKRVSKGYLFTTEQPPLKVVNL